MSNSNERVEDTLESVFGEKKSVWVELSPQDVVTLKHVLDCLFRSVRGGQVDLVKHVAGIENMIDAAHLISIRKALGE